jgi:hypothetical protein
MRTEQALLDGKGCIEVVFAYRAERMVVSLGTRSALLLER